MRDNILRSEINIAAINSRKTHCIHGHEYTKANIKKNPTGRQCKACAYEYERRKKAKLKSEQSLYGEEGK